MFTIKTICGLKFAVWSFVPVIGKNVPPNLWKERVITRSLLGIKLCGLKVVGWGLGVGVCGLGFVGWGLCVGVCVLGFVGWGLWVGVCGLGFVGWGLWVGVCGY